MAVTYRRDLSVTPGGSPVKIYLNQNEDDFSLVFNLYSVEGELEIQNGSTIVFDGTHLKDGSTFSRSGSISGKTVTIQGNKQMTSVAGDTVAEVTIFNSGKRLGAANIILAIEPEAYKR